MLLDAGLKIWADYKELEVGDSLLGRISDGLTRSKFGVVVFSPAFFAKRWTRVELEGLFNLDVSGSGSILPIWHKITAAEVERHSPMLAGRVALDTTLGIDAVGARLFDKLTGARAAQMAARRKRMLDVQHARDAFESSASFTSRDVVKLTGIQARRLAEWQEKTWTGRSGILRETIFTVRNLVAIAALHSWAAVGVPLTGQIAGRVYYAVRAARFPFVLVHMMGGDAWVQAVEPENLSVVLAGSPPAVIFDPESLLNEVYAGGKYQRAL
jgi:hypothetical protein